MSRAALLNGLRLITALGVMLSAVPFLRAGQASHDFGHTYAVQADADLGLGALGGHSHSHSHDDEDGRTPSHGHGYTDHSHVVLGLAAPPSTGLVARQGRLVRTSKDCQGAAGPPFRLDRPPCLVSVG